MEEEGVKSALEIAMERISGMPELTPEEITEQKEKEFRPVGEALANRYMQDIIDEKQILAEITRYRGNSESIVRGAFGSCLCQSIQLEDFKTAVKAMDGLCLVAGDTEALREEADAHWTPTLDGFRQQSEKIIQKYEGSGREKLALLGISGSAVQPNLSENESLKTELDELRRSFEPALENLRTMLREKLSAG